MVDAEHGLFAVIDVPGTVLEFKVHGAGTVSYPGPAAGVTAEQAAAQFPDHAGANLSVPLSALSVHLFKVVGGRIVRIETVSRPAPYGLRSGWETAGQ